MISCPFGHPGEGLGTAPTGGGVIVLLGHISKASCIFLDELVLGSLGGAQLSWIMVLAAMPKKSTRSTQRATCCHFESLTSS